jgi:hypothetical protein
VGDRRGGSAQREQQQRLIGGGPPGGAASRGVPGGVVLAVRLRNQRNTGGRALLSTSKSSRTHGCVQMEEGKQASK